MQTKAIKALLRLVLRLISPFWPGSIKDSATVLGCAEMRNDLVNRLNAVFLGISVDIVFDLCGNALLLNAVAHKGLLDRTDIPSYGAFQVPFHPIHSFLSGRAMTAF